MLSALVMMLFPVATSPKKTQRSIMGKTREANIAKYLFYLIHDSLAFNKTEFQKEVKFS